MGCLSSGNTAPTFIAKSVRCSRGLLPRIVGDSFRRLRNSLWPSGPHHNPRQTASATPALPHPCSSVFIRGCTLAKLFGIDPERRFDRNGAAPVFRVSIPLVRLGCFVVKPSRPRGLHEDNLTAGDLHDGGFLQRVATRVEGRRPVAPGKSRVAASAPRKAFDSVEPARRMASATSVTAS